MTSDTASADARTEWLDVDAATLRDAVGRRPLPVRHSAGAFADFEPSALQPLALRLPAKWVVVNEGDLPLLSPPPLKLAFADGAAALRELYTHERSVRLYHVNHLPEMGPLVRRVLDQVERAVRDYGGGMVRRDSSLFCGSPGSKVPVHCDRHDNLLLQLVGTKQIMVGTFRDPRRELVEIERNAGHHLNLEVMPDDVEVFDLGPGDGLYLPPYTIHWVRCGEQPSTALSASFSTVDSERAELVHLANRQLRRLHVTPRGPGRSRVADRAKAAGITWARKFRARRRVAAP